MWAGSSGWLLTSLLLLLFLLQLFVIAFRLYFVSFTMWRLSGQRKQQQQRRRSKKMFCSHPQRFGGGLNHSFFPIKSYNNMYHVHRCCTTGDRPAYGYFILFLGCFSRFCFCFKKVLRLTFGSFFFFGILDNENNNNNPTMKWGSERLPRTTTTKTRLQHVGGVGGFYKDAAAFHFIMYGFQSECRFVCWNVLLVCDDDDDDDNDEVKDDDTK